jgi:hypothetical protein
LLLDSVDRSIAAMDPTAATDPSAATRKPALNANLASLFMDVMRLGEPSPPEREQRQRQRHAAPVQARPPSPRGQQPDQRYAAMFAGMGSLPPALKVMSKMMQDLQTTRQFWPNSQPCYSYASPVGSSNRAGYASQIGVAAGSAFGGTYGPAPSGAQHQSGPSSSAQQPPSASASQYQPEPAAAPAPMTW